MFPFIDGDMKIDTTVEARRFARLLGEGGWIVGSKNDADYTDMRETVKARRRQVQFILPFCDAFLRPYYLGVDLT